MCFIAFLLQTVSLPSGRVASVFLVALFCYDVFMVFITPLFMPHGDSVMVKVATGGDTHEVRTRGILKTYTTTAGLQIVHVACCQEWHRHCIPMPATARAAGSFVFRIPVMHMVRLPAVGKD